MKVETQKLERHALNWAVAKCEGYSLVFFDDFFRRNGAAAGKSKGRIEGILQFQPLRGKWARLNSIGDCTALHPYSTDWAQGGPIIEREDISFRKYHNPGKESHGTYYARVCRENGTLVGWHKTTGFQKTGPTPLVAAMRCYVASKLGDVVDIPDELL